jgi:hypothetical protein
LGQAILENTKAYFRNTANYLNWQWALVDPVSDGGEVGFTNVLDVVSCFGASTGLCAHYLNPAATTSTSAAAGDITSGSAGGSADGAIVGFGDVTQVLFWYLVGWNTPVTSDTLTGALPNSPSTGNLYSGGTTYGPGATPAPDFSIGFSGSDILALSAGGSGSTSVQLSPLFGFASNVALTSSGAPAGVTVSYGTPTIIGGSGSSTVTVTTTTATPAGKYTILLTGTAGTLSHSVSLTLTVEDFTISASPTSVTGKATSSITISAVAGFTGKVSLGAIVQPPILNAPTASLSAASVTLTSTTTSVTVTLSISITTKTPLGTYAVIVTASSGGNFVQTTVTDTV